MPFGAMFGAVVFAVLCLWYGNEVLTAPSVPHVLTGILWGVLGITLSLGLVLRQTWARWSGIGASILLAAIGARQIVTRGDTLDFVVLLSSIATLALLVVPATGDVRRAAGAEASPRKLGRPLGWTSVSSLVFLTCIALWTAFSPSEAPAQQARPGSRVATTLARPEQPASPRPRASVPAGSAAPEDGKGLSWLTYGRGLKQAGADRTAMLVDFYATWCGPCKMMDRTTFHDPEVIRRLSQIVAVRVDAEDEREQDGFTGAGLAEKYRIHGFPTLVLLDSQGHEVARRAGYQDDSTLLQWLDRVLGPSRAAPSDQARSAGAARS